MKLIKNKKEWDAFKLNTNNSPTRYPVVAWLESVGSSIVGDVDISIYREVPKLNDKDLEIWFAGFKAGKGLS